MYISKVCVRNFRFFDDVGISATFNKGVNAITEKIILENLHLLMR